MAEFPALALWTDSYLADTSHLSDAEHGRYMLLLIHMWRMPQCRFPNDDAWLARKFLRSPEVFEKEWKPLMREYMQNDGNWWTQKRLLKQWNYTHTIRQKNRDIAKARWDKEKGRCDGNARILQTARAKKSVPDKPLNDREKGLSSRNASISISITPNTPPLVPPSVPPTPPPPKRRSAAIGSRWDAERRVPSEWLGDAQVARLRNGLPEIDVRLEAERFENFWASKSGANATKVDWRKTWINWILKAEAPRHGNRPTANDKFLSGVADAIREAAGPTNENGDNIIIGPFGRPLLPP